MFDSTPTHLRFSPFAGFTVRADFEGRALLSDFGPLLLRGVDEALKPISDRIDLALMYGSVAKKTDHADSDIDLMLVSDTLTLEEVFEALEAAENNLSRTINPTLYKREEFKKRRANNNPFLRKVLEGQYILLKGSIDERGSTGKSGPDTQTAP